MRYWLMKSWFLNVLLWRTKFQNKYNALPRYYEKQISANDRANGDMCESMCEFSKG